MISLSQLVLAFMNAKNKGEFPSTPKEWKEFIQFCGIIVPLDTVYGLCVLAKWIYDIPLEREEILSILDATVCDRVRLMGAADPLMN